MIKLRRTTIPRLLVIAAAWLITATVSYAAGQLPAIGNDCLTIQPLLSQPGRLDELATSDLPERLIKDERWMVAEDEDTADLPVIVIRSAQSPSAAWVLRVPEMGILGARGRTGYQSSYKWEQDGPNTYKYDWHPITGSRLPDGPLKGKVRSRISVTSDTQIDFSIDYRNESKQAWELPMLWVCMLQRYAGNGRSFYWSDDGLTTTSSATDPKSNWLNFLPVRGHERFIEAHRTWEEYSFATGVASKPELVWKSTDKPTLEVTIGSPQAAMLGWSLFWPCTDMGILVDEIAAGEQATYSGYVRIRTADASEALP